MLRVTMGGKGLAGFPAEQAGGYVKLRLAPEAGSTKPAVRTYTIRAQRDDAIDVDFVLHEDAGGEAGPATDWAMKARKGDRIEVSGPGPAKPLPADAGFYLVAGDMAALPAIAVNLANLPGSARGFAAIEIQDEADRQDLERPSGFEIEWLVNPHPGAKPDLLAERLRAQNWLSGEVYAWAASEFSSMRALRQYLRDERDLGPDRLYISSYWQAGSTEDLHRLAKRQDSKRDEAG